MQRVERPGAAGYRTDADLNLGGCPCLPWLVACQEVRVGIACSAPVQLLWAVRRTLDRWIASLQGDIEKLKIQFDVT